MPKAAHLIYMQYILAKAKSDESCKTLCSEMVERLEAAITAEDEAFNISLKSSLTDEINDYDDKRDKLYSAYNQMVRSYTRFTKQSTSTSANVLFENLKGYNIKSNMKQNNKSGAIQQLVEDVKTKYAQIAQELRVYDIIEDLEKVNNKVIELISLRSEERTKLEIGLAQKTRNETDEAYRKLVNFVNAYATVNTDFDGFDEFAKYVNQVIKDQKSAQKKGKRS